MKAALLIVLSLSALAYAGPAFNKNTDNQIQSGQKWNQQPQLQLQQQQQHMTTGDVKQTPAVELLKQWCFSSQMSQVELTKSFKQLVSLVKSQQQEDQTTETAVMSERICQWASQQPKSIQSGETNVAEADAKAHELIKDVYMDALIACESRHCMQQLVKIINSNKVDTVRASYYMTRIATTEQKSFDDNSSSSTEQVKQLAESFISGQNGQSTSEAIERQKLFAVTSLIAKWFKSGDSQKTSELKQTAQQVAKTIVERYIKPVGQQEVQQYQQQQPQHQSPQFAKKIAQRNAALKALANIPGWILNETADVKETLIQIAKNKQEMTTARQSAIECLEQCDSVYQQLKEIAFDQEEPIEVRVCALRAAMTSAYAGKDNKQSSEQNKQQMAAEIVHQTVKHCEEQSNQQQDDQFVLYAISYLDNLCTSQQPEHQAIKETIAKNKQHFMQIQVLSKKFKQQLSDVRKSSRNYKLEQEFNELKSGLIVEGDLIYESKQSRYAKQWQSQQQQQQKSQIQILPKVVRFNMSMPVMGETVNVVEITVRQNQMDEELLSALKLVQGAKFNSDSVNKVVDSFKSNLENKSNNNNKQQQQPMNAEADLSIKIDGCTVVYVCLDDFKSSTGSDHQRWTRSTSSIVDQIIEHLKRKPVSFNRGFNFNLSERIAKLLDVDANVIAGLRFESRATGQSGDNYEIVAQVEPRFAIEAIVGPAKLSSKKLLQRFSTKTALGLRLRYKRDQLVDIELDLPMNTMELFTVETQMVEKRQSSYRYLPESMYGESDIYEPSSEFANQYYTDNMPANKLYKRSIFDNTSNKSSAAKAIGKFMKGKRSFVRSLETPESVARATGLRGKLRMVASPKDMSYLVQAIVQKYEPSMQGFRVQIQKDERTSGDKLAYAVTVSTPGSRTDRTMQVRVVAHQQPQRQLVKLDVQSPKMAATVQYELVHDGRQYSVKVEATSSRGKQWRHAFECGVQRASQQQSGRVAVSVAYKPYMSIESSYLRRPVQMQGLVSYQQTSPKSVITYELKSPVSGDFVQGKIVLDERQSSRQSSSSFGKQSRRSMQSPIELLLKNELTYTSEIIAQVAHYAFKSHKMIDYEPSKPAMQADLSYTFKNLRKQTEKQVLTSLKLDQDTQMATVQYKCPQDSRKDFRFTIESDAKQPKTHQLDVELRYNGKRQQGQLNSVVAYKHKIQASKQSSKKAELAYQVELIASEKQLNEKLTGRAQVSLERNMKLVRAEMSSRDKSAKIDVEYESLSEHKIELDVQTERFQHKTSVRADKRQASVQSRTEKDGQMKAKLVMELQKQSPVELRLVAELPSERQQFAADLKFASGKTSSVAVQTGRFSAKTEFYFDTVSRAFNAGNRRSNYWDNLRHFNSLRFKTDLKDVMSKQAYGFDSAFSTQPSAKSYIRIDSPVYRSDAEWEPRQSSAKFGMFAREKRSIRTNDYNKLFDESSLLEQVADKLSLNSNKLWALHSILNSPRSVEQMKEAVRRAIFQYADRRQSHQHELDWTPAQQRLKFSLQRQPAINSFDAADRYTTVSPFNVQGDLHAASFYNTYTDDQDDYTVSRPTSTISMDSDFADFGFTMKPFDGTDSLARFTVNSRQPRNAFTKHETKYSYNKNDGYKAHMKHEDAAKRLHSVHFEADKSPKKYAKLSLDSAKHGKAEYEHDWRQYVNKHKNDKKRSNEQDSADDDSYFSNKVSFNGQSADKNWQHSTKLSWDEPKNLRGLNLRERRSILDSDELSLISSDAKRRYNTIDYLKHVNARLQSQTYRNQKPVYDVDFDYQPQSHARLNVDMPECDIMHTSAIEYLPNERLYKLQAKLMNRRSQQPTYELSASTKPYVYGLASAEQEPMFFEQSHPMLERPIDNTLLASLFKQPVKVDYSDKYGRLASFDYDHSPVQTGKYAGLRLKRAAFNYKDELKNVQHNYYSDFYPQQLLGNFKQSQRINSELGDFVVKANTKYGPIVLKADSDSRNTEITVESPLGKAKLTTVEPTSSRYSSGQTKMVKLSFDNKQKTASLTKIVRRNVPVIGESKLVQKVCQKFDQSRIEHQSEMLVSIVDAIFKIKSQTYVNERPALIIDAEYDEQANKAYAKIDGERVKGQLIADLINKSANLAFDVDNKRTLQHQTRLVRISDKFYSLESTTSYKQQPLVKLSGKVSSMILSEPEHLFARRRSNANYSGEQHISTFEAVVYEPKPVLVSAQYDCLAKEAQIVFKDLNEKKVSTVRVHYDDQTERVSVRAASSSPYGSNRQISKSFDVSPLVRAY